MSRLPPYEALSLSPPFSHFVYHSFAFAHFATPLRDVIVAIIDAMLIYGCYSLRHFATLTMPPLGSRGARCLSACFATLSRSHVTRDIAPRATA